MNQRTRNIVLHLITWGLLAILLAIGIFVHPFRNQSFGAVAGWLSAGLFSIGVVSAGVFSAGIFSAGVFSVGIFTVGLFSIGIFSFGTVVIGVWTARQFIFGGFVRRAKESPSNE